MKKTIKTSIACFTLFCLLYAGLPAYTLDVSAATVKNPYVTSATVSKGSIKIKWSKISGATGYRVYKGGKAVKKITKVSTVTYSDKDLKDQDVISYTVKAYKTTTKWYNKKTKKWVTKKPAKKYLGKSKKETTWSDESQPFEVKVPTETVVSNKISNLKYSFTEETKIKLSWTCSGSVEIYSSYESTGYKIEDI